MTSVIDSVCGEKATGLGDRSLRDHPLEFTDQHGAPVATMKFRILKFRPARDKAPRCRSPAQASPAGTHSGQPLLLRRGRGAQAAHPEVRGLWDPAAPAPAGLRQLPLLRVGRVRGLGPGDDLQLRGHHYPQVPAFDYPLVVAWSNWKRAPASSPTSPASPPRRGHRASGRGHIRSLRRRADPAGVPAGPDRHRTPDRRDVSR